MLRGPAVDALVNMDPRAEGVYCRWDEYPTGSNIYFLVIERVNGDGSVTTLSCTKREAAYIDEFIRTTGARFEPRVTK